jgi:hypothetical protein
MTIFPERAREAGVEGVLHHECPPRLHVLRRPKYDERNDWDRDNDLNRDLVLAFE